MNFIIPNIWYEAINIVELICCKADPGTEITNFYKQEQ